MKIENYKGIDINHNGAKDEFYTDLVVRKGSNGKKDEYICAPRLQRIRDEIDKFLNTAAKKPVLKKAWRRSKHSDDYFDLVTIVLRNTISNTTQVMDKDGKIETIRENSYRSDDRLFISCKENDAIVKALNERQKAIEKLKKEISCSGGKLIPLKDEHFI